MKKELIKRCLAGAPIGLSVCVGITIVISLIVGDGTYYPVVPELTKIFGNEMNAVLVQTIAGILYGAMFGGTSLIWEMEHWMAHSIFGMLAYMGTFFVIYVIIWVSIYLSIRNKLDKINAKVQSK